MVTKDASENLEKEAMRRNLLANMLISTNSRRLNDSHKRWTRFLQELFKKN